MAAHDKFAKAGPPNVALAHGNEFEVYEHLGVLGNGQVVNVPKSTVLEHFEDDPPAAGDWIARGPADILTYAIDSDQSGAALGIVVEESNDGVNAFETTTHEAAHTGGTTDETEVNLTGKYFRFSYTHGATPSDATASIRVWIKRDMDG